MLRTARISYIGTMPASAISVRKIPIEIGTMK